MITIYTTGVFDLLHPGHLRLLKSARSFGDRLIVGIQDDDSVAKQKNKRPIMSVNERKAMLEELPFVDKVLVYSNLDQRKVLKEISPNIMVQSEDWLETGDRTKIVEFLNKNNIRLIQLPYTPGVSSTKIKQKAYEDLKRVQYEENLHFDFTKRLKLVTLSQILTYEKYNELRVQKLISSIRKNKVILNPLSIGYISSENIYLLIDGANRFEALRRIGAKYALVQLIDYKDNEEVELRSNEHFIDCKEDDFINTVGINNLSHIAYEAYTTLDSTIISTSNNKYMLKNSASNINLFDRINILNSFVKKYINTYQVVRKSEVGSRTNDSLISVSFSKFSKKDLIEIAVNNKFLESGISWHVLNRTIARFRLPIDILKSEYGNQNHADKILTDIIAEKVNKQSIRRYISSVYLCDEWDI